MHFKIFGTEIYVSFLFTAVVALMLCVDRTGLVLPTFFAVCAHEIGHLVAMRRCDCNPKIVRLVPASVQIVRRFGTSLHNEAHIALAGPAVNLALSGVLAVNFRHFGNETVLRFCLLNLIFGLFNLLPIRGLDGGTLLKLILMKYTDPCRAEKILRTVTLFFAVAVFLIAIILWCGGTFNPSAFIVGIYFLLTGLLKR